MIIFQILVWSLNVRFFVSLIAILRGAINVSNLTIFTLYTLFGYTNTLDSRDIGAFNNITFNNRIKVKIGLMGGSSYGWGIARLLSKGYDGEATIIYNDKPSGNTIRIVTLYRASYVIKTIR